jgi:hypothetical protein
MSHEFVSDIDRVHVLRGYRRVIWQDLARARQFAKALLDVASYFFAPRSALHAFGVDDTFPLHIVFLVWHILNEHKWLIFR